jgi:hypothetical protein
MQVARAPEQTDTVRTVPATWFFESWPPRALKSTGGSRKFDTRRGRVL